MTFVQENYREVDAQVAEACRRAGRERQEVTLIAVSKMKPEEQILELLEIGCVSFGENKVQDLCRKMEDIPSHNGAVPVWHMIGTLQSNKVKYLADSPVAMIHSVDKVKLAAEINKEWGKKKPGHPVDILLEINIGGEESKSGFAPEEAEAALREIAALPNLRVRGLMTVCPPGSGEENRPYFRRMRELRDRLAALGLPGVEMTELSMGMSHDYAVAIEEGATLVRVGSSIFGQRNYDIPEWTPALQDAMK